MKLYAPYLLIPATTVMAFVGLYLGYVDYRYKTEMIELIETIKGEEEDESATNGSAGTAIEDDESCSTTREGPAFKLSRKNASRI